MNKLFKENHMTISIAIEKALDKIRYSFMIKILRNSKIEKN